MMRRSFTGFPGPRTSANWSLRTATGSAGCWGRRCMSGGGNDRSWWARTEDSGSATAPPPIRKPVTALPSSTPPSHSPCSPSVHPPAQCRQRRSTGGRERERERERINPYRAVSAVGERRLEHHLHRVWHFRRLCNQKTFYRKRLNLPRE